MIERTRKEGVYCGSKTKNFLIASCLEKARPVHTMDEKAKERENAGSAAHGVSGKTGI